MAPSKKLLIALAVGGGLLLLYGPAFLRWAELKSREDQLRLEVVSLQKENQQLYEETRRLREDLSYAEAVARKEMGMVRPGEKMVKFEEQGKAGDRRP